MNRIDFNKMNKYLLIIVSLWALQASAQTQQGYVKTKGRMVEGNLQPGKGLSNLGKKSMDQCIRKLPLPTIISEH